MKFQTVAVVLLSMVFTGIANANTRKLAAEDSSVRQLAPAKSVRCSAERIRGERKPKDIPVKKGDGASVETEEAVDYFGNSIAITFFPDDWQQLLEIKVNGYIFSFFDPIKGSVSSVNSPSGITIECRGN